MLDLLPKAAFSIHPLHVTDWLQWLSQHAPKQLQLIEKVTLAGPDHYLHCPSSAVYDLKKSLPNLIAVGYQCQVPRYAWISDGDYLVEAGLDLSGRWDSWAAVEMMKLFVPAITIVVEGHIWMKKRKIRGVETKEQQGVMRVIREGREEDYEGTGWENSDVKLECIQPRALVAAKDNAGWRKWWKGEELAKFG